MSDCKAITPVTDPTAQHDFTVRIDTQKMISMLGPITIYQLATLKADGTPIFVTPKLHLFQEIKPTCKAILGQIAANVNANVNEKGK